MNMSHCGMISVPARCDHGAAMWRAGGTAGESFTIDVSDYVNNVLNGRTDSRTHAAFAVVRLYRRNSEGSGTYGYSGDSLGSNSVVRKWHGLPRNPVSV